jgi:oligoribonuclease NrnB/cAMP/cGMP phosphodiesterase (DHH superfamily)
MQFFHLSHTDLDGYSCQLISKKIFQDGYFYNANYGLEVKVNLEIILEKIKNSEDKEIFFLITDLNLNPDESKKLNKDVNFLNKNGFNIKLQLLDHHASGQKSADKYEWYYLDDTRSATKITYDYFNKNYPQIHSLYEDGFDTLVEAINAVDIWLDHSPYFEFGKVCMTMVSKAYEINHTLFSDENRNYRLALVTNALRYVQKENGNILLDEQIYHIKKRYLQLENKNDTMDNLSSKYLLKLLDDKKDELTIYYKEHKGLLTFTLGNISIPANTFLKANDDYDFFMDVSRRGKASMRADGKLDVAKLASNIANGGGHPNASGMAFDDWKETINYDDVKNFIKNKFKYHYILSKD